MTKQLETPQLINVEQVSSGWVNKYILTYRDASGREFEYESASRQKLPEYEARLKAQAEGKSIQPDAVCMVPVLPDNSLLMIREFRYPLNAWCVAFPAGLMEPGETIKECAARELREEVGCSLSPDFGDDALRPLPQSGYSSTGLTDENVQVVFARVVQDKEPEPDPNELIEHFKLKFDDVADFLANNKDLIGTRAQLILEMIHRGWAQKRKQPVPQQPITKYDFA